MVPRKGSACVPEPPPPPEPDTSAVRVGELDLEFVVGAGFEKEQAAGDHVPRVLFGWRRVVGDMVRIVVVDAQQRHRHRPRPVAAADAHHAEGVVVEIRVACSSRGAAAKSEGEPAVSDAVTFCSTVTLPQAVLTVQDTVVSPGSKK